MEVVNEPDGVFFVLYGRIDLININDCFLPIIFDPI